MIRAFFSAHARPFGFHRISCVRLIALVCAASGMCAVWPASAQVITIDTRNGGAVAVPEGEESHVDLRYAQITPTNVELPAAPMDERTRHQLIRVLEAEQGFAMRPFPRGHKGIKLVANGKLDPAGDKYLDMAINNGISAKPGDRVVITDLKIDHGKMIFQLNGGPDAKHRFLRHISIGTNPNYTNPVVQDLKDPEGARLTLDFGHTVPALTGKQVKDLLAPLISFDVKTPVQAFTDTLPTPLKDAILNHKVMVGMSTEMVVFAKGSPRAKSREMDGQMPFEEWIYGMPPQEVEFVRINGNRVIRVEIAKVGEPPEIFTQDVVSEMMRTGGKPVIADNNIKVVKEGDVHRDPDRQAPAPPPTLRQPGEPLPTDPQDSRLPPGQRNRDTMRPVQMPKQKPQDVPGYNPDTVPDSQQQTTGQAPQTNKTN